MAGEGEEDVVERRGVDGEALDSARRRVDLVEQRAHVRRAAVRRDPEAAVAGVARRSRGPASARATASKASGAGEHEVEALVGGLPLELRRRALRDHAAAVEDGDAVGQAVGLLQVLRGQEDGDAGLAPGR